MIQLCVYIVYMFIIHTFSYIQMYAHSFLDLFPIEVITDIEQQSSLNHCF